MQVTQEKRPGSQVGLTIVVDAEQVKKIYDKTVRDLVQNFQVQGFRKGKAPRHLVMRYLGKERVVANVIDDLINDSVTTAFHQTKLTPINKFQIESDIPQLIGSFDPAGEFTFVGYVEVYPEVTLGNYKNLTVSPTRVDMDPQQIAATIDRWREQRATLLPIEDRPAQLGDVAVVDFSGVDSHGDPIEGGSATDFQLDLQESNFIPGFVAGVVGMQLDETREIAAQFPEDYFQEALAGQAATFTVTLKELKAKELPELDDPFVQEISDFQTVDELKEHLRLRLIREAAVKSKDNLEAAIIEQILAVTEVDLPVSLIEQESSQLLAQSLSSMQEKGLGVPDIRQFISSLPQETLNNLMERFQPEAINRLKRTLALGKIVENERISVGETELEVAVQEVLDNYPQTRQDVKRLQKIIHEDLLTNKVMNWLKSNTTVTWLDGEGNPIDAPELAEAEEESALDSASSIPEAEFTEEVEDNRLTSEDSPQASLRESPPVTGEDVLTTEDPVL
ncbi:MAG: trigger factor [Cyanobacteriota bacterium]|nr:trigger factor [Cyanobacteriota bacterium]